MAASAASIFSPNSQSTNKPRPFLQCMAANESRQSPIRIKQVAVLLPLPWRLGRPRRTLVPLRVQWTLHRLMAIAFRCQPLAGSRCRRFFWLPGRRRTVSHSDSWLLLQTPFPGLPLPSSLMRSSTPQRASAPSTCGNTLLPAYALTPWWRLLCLFSLSCVRKTVWPRRRIAAHSRRLQQMPRTDTCCRSWCCLHPFSFSYLYADYQHSGRRRRSCQQRQSGQWIRSPAR